MAAEESLSSLQEEDKMASKIALWKRYYFVQWGTIWWSRKLPFSVHFLWSWKFQNKLHVDWSRNYDDAPMEMFYFKKRGKNADFLRTRSLSLYVMLPFFLYHKEMISCASLQRCSSGREIITWPQLILPLSNGGQ